MPDPSAAQIELLLAAYAAFNSRDTDAALALMTPDVAWPRAFKGGFVQGPEAIRAYWTEQWGEIDPHVEPVAFHPEDTDRILVEVHQVVRDLAGAVIADDHVGHRFTLNQGLIQIMEVHSLQEADQDPVEVSHQDCTFQVSSGKMVLLSRNRKWVFLAASTAIIGLFSTPRGTPCSANSPWPLPVLV